ncbi:hypothetical protein ABZ359_42580 [Streptomyces sp. NPDC005968]|uniref:DUF7405 family protein n=1 Tax=Streptomyces sp. NPDC005968 TaxID=3154574 RepID=UPI0033D3024B
MKEAGDHGLSDTEESANPSRRSFVAGATLGMALTSAGIYEVIDKLISPPERAAVRVDKPLPPEQYAIPTPRLIKDNGEGVASSGGTIPVLIPPLHNHVITATLRVPANVNALQEAQRHLESVIQDLEKRFPPPPSGLGVVVAWGLPYFQHYIPSLGRGSGFFKAGTRYPNYLPVDLMTSKEQGHTVYALQDARTYPSDQPPAGFGQIRLEQNHVAVLLRSDSLDNIMEGTNALFGAGRNQAGDLFTVTSIRRGFTGGGHTGQQSLASELAVAADLPGANSIPKHAPIFFGFTTTIKSAESSTPVSNLETLPGRTDQWPDGYFKYGTIMPLSHLYSDLGTWYGQGRAGSQDFPDYADRLRAMYRPGLSAPEGTVTLDPPVEDEDDIFQQVRKSGGYGHNGSMQPVNRLQNPTTSNYGVTYPAGTPVSNRGDFATLDNPFHYTSDPVGDHYSSQKAAGLHFLIFVPTVETFNRIRLAMDGYYPDGRRVDFSPRSPKAGLNSVVHTTHRQNFLIPPRSRRSFPLAEFLT